MNDSYFGQRSDSDLRFTLVNAAKYLYKRPFTPPDFALIADGPQVRKELDCLYADSRKQGALAMRATRMTAPAPNRRREHLVRLTKPGLAVVGATLGALSAPLFPEISDYIAQMTNNPVWQTALTGAASVALTGGFTAVGYGLGSVIQRMYTRIVYPYAHLDGAFKQLQHRLQR